MYPSDASSEEDDLLDGCEEDFTQDPISDDDEPYVALFAGVPEAEVEAHAEELRRALGEG